MMTWWTVLISSFGAFLLKFSGYALPERWFEHPRLQRIANLIPVALLSALVITQTFSNKHDLVIDTRFAGLGVAIIALAFRAPFIVMVLLSALTSAILHRI